MSKTRARLMFITAVAIYGTLGPIVRFINVSPEVLVLIRGLLGSATIAAVLALRGTQIDIAALRRNAGWLIGTGVCLGINWVALFAAYRYTSVAIASVCNYTAPVIVVLLAPMLFHEQITPFKLGCVAVALVGIVLVSGVVEADVASFNPLGIGLGMVSALGFVGILVCNRFVGKMEPLQRVFVQLSVAALVALTYVLVVDGGIPLPQDSLSWLLVVVLGVVHTGFAYILWFGAQPHLPLSEIALLGYLEPVMSVVLSAVVIGEPLTALGTAGAALVLGAAAASEVRG